MLSVFHSIKGRLIFFSLCIALIPITAVITMFYLNTRNTLKHHQMDVMRAIAESKRLHIMSFMETRCERVVDFGSDGFIKDTLEAISRDGVGKDEAVIALNKHLSTNKKPLDSYILAIAVVGKNGKVVAATSKALMGKDMSGHEAFTQAIGKRSGEVCVARPGCFPFMDVDCIPVSSPVISPSGTAETIGVIINIYDLACLNEITTDLVGMGETGETVIGQKSDNRIVYLTSLRHVPDAHMSFSIPYDSANDQPMKLALQGGSGIVLAPDYRGVIVIAAYHYIPSLRCGLVVKTDKIEILAAIKTLGRVALIVWFATAIVVAGTGIILVFSIVSPLQKLTHATKIFSEGNLTYQIRIDRKDEIGCLARSFNTMANGLSREIDGHVQAKKKLAERENYLKTIINSEPDCVKLTDTDGIILEMNAAGMAMVEVESSGQIVGRSVYSSIVPEYLDAYKALMKRIFRGESGTLEYEIVGNKGTRFWLETKAVPLRNEKDEIFAALWLTRNITDRKKLEEKLKESEARFRTLVESTTDWVWELDKDGIFTYVSPKVYDILGYTPEDILGKTPFILMASEEVKRATEFFVTTSVSKKSFSMFESIHIHKDGRPVVIDTSGIPILDANGSLIGYRGINRDVTERRTMENALRKRDAQYSAMLNTIPDGFWIIDTLGRLLDVNDAYCRMIGYSRNELLGMSVTDVEAQETQEETERHIRHVIEIGSDIFETRHRRKDGNVIPIEVCACYYPIDGGRFFSFIRDITPRKAAEENLRKLSHAVEQSASIIVITNEMGNIEYANPKFTEITGYTLEEAKGQNPRILKSGETPPEVYERLWSTITSGREWRGEFCNKKKTGEFYYESASIAPIKNTKGIITHFIAVKEDITLQKHKEEELRRTVEEKKKSIEDLQRLMEFSQLMREEIVEGALIKHAAKVLKERFSPDSLAMLMLNKEENSVEIPVTDPVIPWNEIIREEVMQYPTLCRVMRTGQTAVVHDVDTDICCDCLLFKMKEGSSACFPISASGITVGAVMMAKNERGYWDSCEKQRLISAYIGLAASSLDNIRLMNQAKRSAITDVLTGAYNRRFFIESLEKLFSLAKRYKETLTVILADVDHFKHFNDTYGHTAGDRVLQQVSKILGNSLRESDVLCRYGGEEFAIIMPRTSATEGYEKAENIRRYIESARFNNIAQGNSLGITISMGIASFPEHGNEGNALVNIADSALYKAKKNGRNRVEMP